MLISEQFRQSFPFLLQKKGVYLDSAATTLKPQILLDSTADFYSSAGSVHRSQYDLVQTQAYEEARKSVADWFNVSSTQAVVWTSGTTQSINLVAQGLQHQWNAGDEIILSVAEHHANFIPWQQLAQKLQLKLTVLPLNEYAQIDPAVLKVHLSQRTKLVACNLVSNVTGIRQPVEQLIPLIRQYSDAKILLDIAQAVCYEPVNVSALGADFYTFSAHKMYGPTGVGVLMGDLSSLTQIRPLVFGGKMLLDVNTHKLELAPMPYCLEAGTPNIAGIIGFGAVLHWLKQWDFESLNRSLYQLTDQFYTRLTTYSQIDILGKMTAPRTIYSFNVSHLHYSDLSALLSEQGIALRSGRHCAYPYFDYLQCSGSLRVSFAHYNNQEDINAFFEAFEQALIWLN